jgi:hypothetical protein
VSHPDPNAAPDPTPIAVGEVWENPVTGEYARIDQLPWGNPDERAVAELRAVPGARVPANTSTPPSMSGSQWSRGS